MLWTCGSRKYAFGSCSADPSEETPRVPTPDTCREAREASLSVSGCLVCVHLLTKHLSSPTGELHVPRDAKLLTGTPLGQKCLVESRTNNQISSLDSSAPHLQGTPGVTLGLRSPFWEHSNMVFSCALPTLLIEVVMWIRSFLETDCLAHDSISWPEILLSRGRWAKCAPERKEPARFYSRKPYGR